MVNFTLSYVGALADNNVLDMYDASRALAGFQRSLALTTHLILNGEIITQAPALKGASIISSTPEPGSWKVTAVVIAGLWTVSTASKDTVPGHLLFSAYDYVVRSTLGFPVDFDETLMASQDKHLEKNRITAEKMDSLIEKTESSVADMHRPFVASKSATSASIVGSDDYGKKEPIGPELSILTYDYIATSKLEDGVFELDGIVSSFNLNTFKGRVFSLEDQRPIPFEISADRREGRMILDLANSLRENASKSGRDAGLVRLRVRKYVSANGRLKSLIVFGVDPI
ncbi:MAG TPA: hypothetical protein VGN68_10055 [Sphingopyxis sp.]|jgi:hypothetical protein|uniref:DUF7946 domain-containing protein n=1 Tax=Sphingopyxis sp. TaxID=1908224 RepID=UPI002E11E73F|nr:hypothetical protein [Sphingopyxis sp.]